MNKPLRCSRIGIDYLDAYSDKALRGEVLISYQLQIGSKWRLANSSNQKENDFSEKVIESVYLFPDDAAKLLRYSSAHTKRFTKPLDQTFGGWFQNGSNPKAWIEAEPLQHVQKHHCFIYLHPNFSKNKTGELKNIEEEKINPRERDSYLKLIAILSHNLAHKFNGGSFVKADGSLNVDHFADRISNYWKELAPRKPDNMSKSNIRKKLREASKSLENSS